MSEGNRTLVECWANKNVLCPVNSKHCKNCGWNPDVKKERDAKIQAAAASGEKYVVKNEKRSHKH